MTTGPLARKMTRRGGPLALAAVTLFAALIFGGYLEVQNRRAEALFNRLKATDPPRYLDDLRRMEGFDAYVTAYRTLRGFGAFRPEPPRFLVGRWTLRDKPVRLPPSGSFAQCENPLVIETGHIEVGPQSAARLKDTALYRLTETGMLEVKTGEHGLIGVQIVSYGAQIDHLALTPPGEEALLYAYPCTA